ncbi:MAG: AraC family transcriptional regulator [Pseudoalteromonas sp.]|nr:AraC family transcriptional regulator [Pseudoalteromonas sp.]|tara:strand:- start:285 stop:992 length:708 start_codon:yes stop_codon:yes gene_type:complete
MKNLLSIRSYSASPVSHSHDFNQVVLPLRGVINIQVEGFSGKVAPRECVIVRSNEEHLFTAEREARFIVADMDRLPSNVSASQHIVFEINKPLLNYLLFIESQLEYQINAHIEQSMYNTFYLLLESQHLLPKLDLRIHNALNFINENIAEPLKIESIAKEAFLSPTQFKKIFKEQLGLTVLEYITALRMEKAQALLTHTDYPLQIIGENVGYKELSSFSRKFKQHYGFPPTKFKS